MVPSFFWLSKRRLRLIVGLPIRIMSFPLFSTRWRSGMAFFLQI